MKYRKNPIEVEAFQFEALYPEMVEPIRHDAEGYAVYDKLHDTWVKFEVGDYIIQGIQGEYYPCKKEVFETTYTKAE